MKVFINTFTVIAIVFIFFSCSESPQKLAQRSLQLARLAYEHGDYQSAKSQIDSIKILFPKVFDVRREALKLMREVELAEQQRCVVYFDSLLVSKREELEKMLQSSDIVFEKDEKYQEIGNFMIASQAPMKNLKNSYIRGQVDENGVMTVTSIYRGKPISHEKLRVSVGDSFVESSNYINKYVSSHLGVTTERLDFRFGKDDGIGGFIVLNRDKNIKVELIGKSVYSYIMSQDNIKAIVKLFDLCVLLESIYEIEASKQETERHIEFIKRNMSKSQTDETLIKS